MSTRRFPLRAAANLYLERQHLLRPRARRLTPARLRAFVEATGGLQLDSINVVERAHYLTLWSRYGPYAKADVDRWTYRRKLLFEYWAHAACLIPVRDLPAWRRAMLDYSLRNRNWRNWLLKNTRLVRRVEAEISARGPLGNADFERPKAGKQGGGWWNWKPASHALDYLWMSGRTLVESRVHFQKRFDLAARVLPAMEKVEPLAAEEFGRWHMRRALQAMGAASEPHLRGYLTFPHTEAPERRRRLQALVRAGEVVAVEVEGESAPWFALVEDLPALERAAARRTPARGTTLLSPFDSFLWDRSRVATLFGFDYRIEVYTPGHKRVHGYYSLPIFHDGHLIGRLDPKTHRERGVLEVRQLHFESWFGKDAPPRAGRRRLDVDAALAGTGDALRSLATFVGAERVTLGRVTPARLSGAARAALRGAGASEPA